MCGHQEHRRFARRTGPLLIVCVLAACLSVRSQESTSANRLVVDGDVQTPLSLSLQDLAQLPRTTITVSNEHEAEKQTYEGVTLAELLRRSGAPQGAKIRGPVLATYVLASAVDGYRVIFSLAELDSDFQDSGVIVADKMNGKPLADKVGPLRLVVPHDKRPARWIRMLQAIKVVTVPQAEHE